MRRQVIRAAVTGLLISMALGACGVGRIAPWTFAPAPTGQASGAPTPTGQPGASVAPSPTIVATSTLLLTASPATTPQPTVSPATTPGPTESPEATPRPPDPGEPGFVAGTKTKPRTIDIAMTDLLLYDPTVVTVQQGETITFRLTNTGLAEHEFKVGPMQDVFDDLPSAPEISSIAAGATETLTYTFTDIGPYAYGCHEPGHFENGMYGFVNVVPTTPWLGSQARPRMIVLQMDDHLEFVPAEISVTPGETILFVLANVGTALVHEFQLGPADRVALDQVDGQIVVEADQIEPLHVAYLTYSFGSVGPYSFACHEPGHYEAGMKGIVDLTP